MVVTRRKVVGKEATANTNDGADADKTDEMAEGQTDDTTDTVTVEEASTSSACIVIDDKEEVQQTMKTEEKTSDEGQDTSVTINLELKDSKSAESDSNPGDEQRDSKAADEVIKQEEDEAEVKEENDSVVDQVKEENISVGDQPDDDDNKNDVKTEDADEIPADDDGDTENNKSDIQMETDVVLIDEDEDHNDVDNDKSDSKLEETDEAVVIEDNEDHKDADHAESEKDKSTDVIDADATADDDKEETLSYPESFTKLNQLTVNIGPIKQRDLMSRELHSILNLTWNFEIKFEKKIKEQDGGGTKSERPGFVRIPFTVMSPRFLVTIAKKLGNLRIDGRDMSVKFPEAFNNAVKDCEEYLKKLNEVMAKRKMKKVELMKRQILVRNVPDKVEEETIKSMFPEAAGVTMNMITTGEDTKKVGSVMLDFLSEKACLEFLQSNRDVQIGDCKVKLTRNYSGDSRRPRPMAGVSNNGRGGRRPRGTRAGLRARGRGGFGQNMGQFGMQQKGARGGGQGIMGSKPGLMSAPSGRGNAGNNRRNSQSGNTQNRGRGQQNQGSQNRMQNQGRPQQSPGRQDRGPTPLMQQRTPPRSSPGRGGATQGGGRMGQVNRGQMQQQRGGGRSMRGGRQGQARGGRMQEASSSRRMSGGGGGEEDPVVMMAYLKSTLARMEEKITQRSGPSDYDYDGGYGNQRDSYGGTGAAGRKRKTSMGEPGYMTNKRTYGDDRRYADRETSYDDSRYSNSKRGYNDSGTFQDDREDYYKNIRTNRQGQGNFTQSYQGQRNYGGQSNFGNRGNTNSGNRFEW